MRKKSKPQTTEDKLNRDLTTFERLPEKTKELMQLKEREERTIGPEDVGDSKKKNS